MILLQLKCYCYYNRHVQTHLDVLINGHSGTSFKFVVSPVGVFRKLNSSVTGLKQALKISDSN